MMVVYCYSHDWNFGHCPLSPDKTPTIFWKPDLTPSSVAATSKGPNGAGPPLSILQLKMKEDPTSKTSVGFEPDMMDNVQNFTQQYYIFV